jgi:hypothetical protein
VQTMTKEQKVERIRTLLLDIEKCEHECHALGFHETAHLVNGVKNGLGWSYARFVEAADHVGKPREQT